MVFVDADVPQLETLLAGIASDADIVLLTPSENAIDQITRTLADRKELPSIHIISHGRSGAIQLGGQLIDEAQLRKHQPSVQAWGKSLSDDGDILLYGCDVAAGAAGELFVQALSELTSADVAASTNQTGHTVYGRQSANANSSHADWELESTVGDVQASLVVSTRARREFHSTLLVSIFAAGVTGSENLALQIDEQTVAEFSGIGGDVETRTFEQYSFENASPVTADQIRVLFTNDLVDLSGDRNLLIDRIEIDGVAFETEDDSTFSTGLWNPLNQAAVPRFAQSEWLYTNGFFEYANQNATTIEIDAAGMTGEEVMRLTVGGQEIESWNVSTAGETFTAQIDRVLDPAVDFIRVELINDLYDPENGIDRNLQVSGIRVNGQSFTTADPSTYSTGVWTNGVGIDPGYLRGEFLHVNGFFEFDAPPSTVIVQANGDEGTEHMKLNIGGQDVAEFDITTQTQSYSYTHTAPISANDVRLIFDNDVVDPNGVTDPNLNVDWIEVDGYRVETDSPYVFSTGVFSPDAQAILPGYGIGNTLNTNGYFQYATGAVIEIIARGESGTENFDLVVDGRRVDVFDVTDQFETYTYTAGKNVSANQIRVEYNTDEFVVPGVNDRNLIVDAIVINGVRYETEVPSTYSAGTGVVDGAIQHGFGHGDTLFYNGFFHYHGAFISDDAFSIPEDSLAVPLAVLANDVFSDYNLSNIVLQSETQNGDLELIDGIVHYTPATDFVGTDSFSYTIMSNNGSLVPATADVTITVNQSHQQPQTQINSAVAPELTPSGKFLEVRRFAKLPLDTAGRQPRMNSFATLGNRLFVVTDGTFDNTGEIYEIVSDSDGNTSVELLFDVATAIVANTGLDVVNSNPLFGIRNVAFHPEFATNGKFYTTYTGERPADPSTFTYLSDPQTPVPVDNVLAEWTFDFATAEVDLDSYREVFRIGMVAEDHPIQNMLFNPYAQPGDADYGLMYVGVGDGSVQSAIAGDGLNNDALGKILRVDPLATDTAPYSTPDLNPFVDDTRYPDEVYAVGFRNPHNLAFAQDATGDVHLLVTDIGRDNVEEVNIVVAGASYGWADREGVFVHLGEQAFINGNIAALPADEAANGYTFPVAILGHEGIFGESFVGQAITGGHVIQNGSSALDGQFIFAEFATDGRAYHIDFAQALEQITTLDSADPNRDTPDDLTWLTPQELTILFDHDNDPSTTSLVRDSLKDVLDDEEDFVAIASAGKIRADLRFGQGPGGELYILNKRNGWVYIATNTLPSLSVDPPDTV
ncbi:carbohydrate-binding domain-containing protein [Stieleria varia]|uniref:carbohydrate-binding domain-containing protein n=1 Tax=Stieleria varia TaxID=2528005 RepID=UPI00313DB4A6